MSTTYEWDVETVTAVETSEHEENEALDHHFCKNFSEALNVSRAIPPAGCRYEVVLVRNTPLSRSWAYLIDGKLPEHFEDANGVEVARVPLRFHKQAEGEQA